MTRCPSLPSAVLAGVACLLLTEWRSEREQVLRYEQSLLPGARTWVGGIEAVHGDRLRFGQGFCQMVMAVDLSKATPGPTLLSPCFRESVEVAREQAVWDREVSRRKPYLERAVQQAPGSPEAIAAQAVLSALP